MLSIYACVRRKYHQSDHFLHNYEPPRRNLHEDENDISQFSRCHQVRECGIPLRLLSLRVKMSLLIVLKYPYQALEDAKFFLHSRHIIIPFVAKRRKES